MILRKTVLYLSLYLFAAIAASGQTKVLAIGDVSLQLGTKRNLVLKSLEAYRLTAFGSDGFSVSSYDKNKKSYERLGAVGFDNGLLSWITRDIDTSAWPNDEGYAVARAISDTIGGSIPYTDRDGAKRASITVVTNNQDGIAGGSRINLRTLSFIVNDREISILISDDSQNGKSVDVSISIRSKPW